MSIRGDYQLRQADLRDGIVQGSFTGADGTPLRWSEVITSWQRDAGLREAFTEALAEAPFEAFFWETPAVSRENVERPFEFVLVDSPQLAGVKADIGPFFQILGAGKGVRTFPNLGGDARLVAPCPEGAPAHYPHLAAFVRGAPRPQIQALWAAVGRATHERLRESDAPLWISTSGLGVYWVHVRLDERPKYYTHAPYRGS